VTDLLDLSSSFGVSFASPKERIGSFCLLMLSVLLEESGHQFLGANVLLFIGVIVLSLCIGHLIHKYEFHYLPESCATLLLGLAFGGIVLLFGREESSYVMFKPDIFFYLLLPPIIFEAGYSMKKAHFFQNMTTILLFAIVGTLLSALFIGFALYGVAKSGAIGLDASSPAESLTLGSLISAVDPVATLAILGSPSLGADPLLYSLVFGESILNDAVSIALFHTFDEMSTEGFNLGKALGSFLALTLGSLSIGVVIALVTSFLFKRFKVDSPAVEFVLILCCSYSSYCLAEVIGLSGILSMFFCGVLVGHYAIYNISHVGRITIHHSLRSMTVMAETFLFAYLGITCVISSRPMFNFEWDFALTALLTLFCILSRFCIIIPLGMLANLRRKVKLSPKVLLFMSFAGVRGAIAFALALNVESPGRPRMVTATMGTVVFTTLVMGGLTQTVLVKLGLVGVKDEPEEHAHLVSDETETPRRRGGMHGRWVRFDEKVMKRLFGGRPRSKKARDFTQPVSPRTDGGSNGETKVSLVNLSPPTTGTYQTPLLSNDGNRRTNQAGLHDDDDDDHPLLEDRDLTDHNTIRAALRNEDRDNDNDDGEDHEQSTRDNYQDYSYAVTFDRRGAGGSTHAAPDRGSHYGL